MPKRILIYGIWSLIAGIFFMVGLTGIANELQEGSVMTAGVTVIIHLIFSCTFVVGGIGVLLMKAWARKLMIYTAVALMVVTACAESAVFIASQLSAGFGENINYLGALAIPTVHFLVTLLALNSSVARPYFR